MKTPRSKGRRKPEPANKARLRLKQFRMARGTEPPSTQESKPKDKKKE